MKLKIISPGKTILEADTEKVTLPGADGSFTILKGHAALVSLLAKGKVTHGSGTETEIEGGIAEVGNDCITIYV